MEINARADAGTIAVSTATRIESALAHYTAFLKTGAAVPTGNAAHAASPQHAAAFAAWLSTRKVTANGRSGGGAIIRLMASSGFVLDTVRAMFEWANDPRRGALMPPGFVNPFSQRGRRRRRPDRDLLADPDITVDMAVAFFEAADAYQLRLFAPILLWGLRPSEAVWMFREHLHTDVFRHACVPELGYVTKGVQNKSLPMIPELYDLLSRGGQTGLLLARRDVASCTKQPPLLYSSIADLVREYQRRIGTEASPNARRLEIIRDSIIADAGGLTYKMIQGEFARLATRLSWPRTATLKDFRHLCQTAMANGGMSIEERQYMLGQSITTAAISSYMHLNKLSAHYTTAVRNELSPVLSLLRDSSHRSSQEEETV